VRLKTGWFSDRSATYLAAGRPVVTQDTGFGVALPTGEGLFAWTTVDEAATAVEQIAAAHDRHARAARELAEEHFAAERVLRDVLDHLGLGVPTSSHPEPGAALPADLELEPVARRPTTLAPETLQTVAALDIHRLPARPLDGPPDVTIVVVTRNGLPFSRLCLESVLGHTERPRFELVVVDNASTDGTREYVAELAVRFGAVRAIFNAANAGFPAAANQGLDSAAGQFLVLANNDVIVAPGWLERLVRHLDDPTAGLVGPVTNRIGTAAEVDVSYHTIGGFLEEAAGRRTDAAGWSFAIDVPAMFCVALSRETWAAVGPLDERFGIGTLEDDDYARRVRDSGRRTMCAEDVLVHHFGEASFGALYADGTRNELLERNRRLYTAKWREEWQPYERSSSDAYTTMKRRIQQLVRTSLPGDDPLIVVSKGDEDLVWLNGHPGWHFPQTADGTWAGHHPGSSEEAIAELETLCDRGGRYLIVPESSRWWLEHYTGLRRYLERSAAEVVDDESCVVFRLRADDS
jgi:GT2 family glycosyltransferase